MKNTNTVTVSAATRGEGVGFERIRRITGYLVGTTDKHPTFVKKIEDALCEGSAFYHLDNKRFTILTPIMGCSKEDTIRLGQEYNADFSLSWSCYNSEVNFGASLLITFLTIVLLALLRNIKLMHYLLR